MFQRLPAEKVPFLYALVMENPLGSRVAIPISEMISTSQYGRETRHWLSVICDTARDNSIPFKPTRVESDMSFTILQSVSAVLNNTDLKGYLQWCWEVQTEKLSTKQINSKVILHVCVAHMMKIFSRQASKCVNDKSLRQFILYSMGYLVNLSDLSDIRCFFQLFCTVLESSFIDDVVQRSIDELVSLVKGDFKEEDLDADQGSSNNMTIDMPTEQTMRASRFYAMSREVQKNRHVCTTGTTPNPYYNPEFLENLTKNQMGLLPLWTGLMLGDLKQYAANADHEQAPHAKLFGQRASTAHVENYFKNVKGEIIKYHWPCKCNFLTQVELI